MSQAPVQEAARAWSSERNASLSEWSVRPVDGSEPATVLRWPTNRGQMQCNGERADRRVRGQPGVRAPADEHAPRNPHRRQARVIEVRAKQFTDHAYRECRHLGFLGSDHRGTLQRNDIPNSSTTRPAIEATSVPDEELFSIHEEQWSDWAHASSRPRWPTSRSARAYAPGTAPAWLISPSRTAAPWRLGETSWSRNRPAPPATAGSSPVSTSSTSPSLLESPASGHGDELAQQDVC